MNELEFDQALSSFLNEERCEKVNKAVFELVEAAFTAGWKAAMGSDLKKIMKLDKR